jgi:3-oxoacyl-[acyl-carrier protein] reductase
MGGGGGGNYDIASFLGGDNALSGINLSALGTDLEELDLSNNFKISKPNFDIVINNAGINPLNNILNVEPNIIMQVNYFAPLQIIQQCLPYMIKQGYGRVINIGSIWIDLAKEKRGVYSSSKSALHALTKTIATEYSSKDILANTISPGFIYTDLTKQNNTLKELKKISKNIPIGRLGKPFEIAKTIYHLTVENTYITGQNITIDGGYSCTAH